MEIKHARFRKRCEHGQRLMDCYACFTPAQRETIQTRWIHRYLVRRGIRARIPTPRPFTPEQARAAGRKGGIARALNAGQRLRHDVDVSGVVCDGP